MTERPRAQDSSGDFLFVGLVIVGFAATVAHWLAAQLATLVTHGHTLDDTFSDSIAAFRFLPAHLKDPRLAWPESSRSDIPGPIVYWAAVTVVVVVLVVAVCIGYSLLTTHTGSGIRVRTSASGSASRPRPGSLAPVTFVPCSPSSPSPTVSCLPDGGAGSSPPKEPRTRATERSPVPSPSLGHHNPARPLD